MKVREFIELLNKEYDPEEELYFTTWSLDTEFVFDTVLVQPKEDKCDETDVYLDFNEENRKVFTDALAEDSRIDLVEDLKTLIYKYG